MTEAKLLAAVKKQVEFYFSDSAYRRDTFLKTAVANDPEGFVPITTLLTFNKLKNLTTDAAVVAEALKDSEVLVLSSDQTKVKRSEPLPDVDDSSLRTLYVKGYPTNDAEVTIESVTEQFSVYGKINYVKLRREVGDKSFKGSVFIEFSTEEELQKAYTAANEGGTVQIGYKGTPFLCVLPFNQWHTNKQLKKPAGKRKAENQNANESKDGGDAEEEKAQGNSSSEKKEEGFEKGLLLEIENVPKDVHAKSFREFLNKHAEVAYVENSGESKVIVRLKSAEEAEKLRKVIEAGLKYPEDATVKLGAHPVSEVVEKDFYDRLKSNVTNGAARNDRGGRGRGRGGGGFHGKNKRQRR